jgi:hypothetical protein
MEAKLKSSFAIKQIYFIFSSRKFIAEPQTEFTGTLTLSGCRLSYVRFGLTSIVVSIVEEQSAVKRTYRWWH